MILIFGASGYVGQMFCDYLELNYHGQYKKVQARGQTPDSLRKIFKDERPTFVINCAGFTGKPNVDACEAQKDECFKGNVLFPTMLADVCSTYSVALGHVSSGCIYNGYEKVYTEEDEPNFTFKQNNCSFYSGTKALAENILKDFSSVYIWRLRIPFNEDLMCKRNYLFKILHYERLLDAINSISQIDEFVRACVMCWESSAPYGIYNIINPGAVTTHWITEQLSRYYAPSFPTAFRWFENLEEFNKTVKAPRSNCVLDSSKIQSLGINLTPVEDAIIDAIKLGSSAEGSN